jgi:hypothetical protein
VAELLEHYFLEDENQETSRCDAATYVNLGRHWLKAIRWRSGLVRIRSNVTSEFLLVACYHYTLMQLYRRIVRLREGMVRWRDICGPYMSEASQYPYRTGNILVNSTEFHGGCAIGPRPGCES